MSLIQPIKFRKLEMGHFKTPHFDVPRLRMVVFQMVVTVAFGGSKVGLAVLMQRACRAAIYINWLVV